MNASESNRFRFNSLVEAGCNKDKHPDNDRQFDNIVDLKKPGGIVSYISGIPISPITVQNALVPAFSLIFICISSAGISVLRLVAQ